MKKSNGDPMQRAHAAPRCTANSKRTGLPCKNPAVRGWTVCRMHGARGGAPSGTANPNWRHGGRSGEAVALRKMVNALGREARKLAGAVPPKSTTTALAALERQGETEQSSHEDLLNSTREG